MPNLTRRINLMDGIRLHTSVGKAAVRDIVHFVAFNGCLARNDLVD